MEERSDGQEEQDRQERAAAPDRRPLRRAPPGIEVSFEAPTRDWAARRNAPAVNAYLYDIRE
ncbi:Pvc16 family protein, partial [Streptomyces sp. NPDC089915]|uniref:Pvc16 family protein n=1 Tax=Streptomyces sp. NPDC089915 TaxID=3155186 RepID=UPI003414827F